MQSLALTNWIEHMMCRERWGYAFMAMDMAIDKRGNAFVLDVNSGPSYYHFELPVWYTAIVKCYIELVRWSWIESEVQNQALATPYSLPRPLIWALK